MHFKACLQIRLLFYNLSFNEVRSYKTEARSINQQCSATKRWSVVLRQCQRVQQVKVVCVYWRNGGRGVGGQQLTSRWAAYCVFTHTHAQLQPTRFPFNSFKAVAEQVGTLMSVMTFYYCALIRVADIVCNLQWAAISIAHTLDPV